MRNINQIFTAPQTGYESIDPFEAKSQPNSTLESFIQTAILNCQNLESAQVQENLREEINQITLNNSTNIEQALNSLKFLHLYSTSRKSDKEVLANNLPSKTAINNLPNNLPNNNLLNKSTEMMNLVSK